MATNAWHNNLATRPEDIPSSPFFLGANENPTLALVSSVLTGSNLHQWSRAMRMSLLSKNKLKFVNGSIPVPGKDDPLFPAWERCNNMVISWLIHSISPHIAQSIMWLDSALEIWKNLHSRFSQCNSFRVCDLQTELYTLQQGSLSVQEYFTRLKIVWDELMILRPLPSCSCDPQCSYFLSKKIREYYDNDQVLVFLKALNENYNTAKSQILLMDLLPSINKLFSMVIQQEKQTQVIPQPSEVSAMAVQNYSQKKYPL